MIFLFVGSSGLTEDSYPRNLAIPQLLRSSAHAVVPTITASPTAVFPRRGLAPHQFTPMSGAHKAKAPARSRRFPAFVWRRCAGCASSSRRGARSNRKPTGADARCS